jgi:hypothetical protein
MGKIVRAVIEIKKGPDRPEISEAPSLWKAAGDGMKCLDRFACDEQHG